MSVSPGLTRGRSADSEASAMSVAERRALLGEVGLAPMPMMPGYGDIA